MVQIRKPAREWKCFDDMAGRLGILDAERPLVEEVLHRGLEGVIPVTPKGSKVIRARAVIPLLEAGDIHLDARASWLPRISRRGGGVPSLDGRSGTRRSSRHV